jgi:REP element-mobilizing transposase RayT
MANTEERNGAHLVLTGIPIADGGGPMARRAGNTPGGYVYQVLNRSSLRIALIRNEDDYAAFERFLSEAHGRIPLRILAWCLMKSHWHFVVWPQKPKTEGTIP